MEPPDTGTLGFQKSLLHTAQDPRDTHHNHDVPPTDLVELLHHGREVPEVVLVEGEVPSGIHVVEVIPLDVLQPQHMAVVAQAHHPHPSTGPRPLPSTHQGEVGPGHVLHDLAGDGRGGVAPAAQVEAQAPIRWHERVAWGPR